jgi:hypothetical protein
MVSRRIPAQSPREKMEPNTYKVRHYGRAWQDLDSSPIRTRLHVYPSSPPAPISFRTLASPHRTPPLALTLSLTPHPTMTLAMKS